MQSPEQVREARFIFVLEQTLGHVSHSRNIERALGACQAIDPTIVHLNYSLARGLRRTIPGLRTWTFESSLRTRSALRDRLRQSPADAVFIHTQVAALFAKQVMRRVPTVISLDATPLNFDQEGEPYGHRRNLAAVEALKRRLNRDALDEAAALVTWCRWAANSLVNDYGISESKIHVIPPGVDVDLFQPGGVRPPGPVRLLFVGGDFARKGGLDLLEAMRRLGRVAELDVVTGTEDIDVPAGVTCRIHRGLTPQSSELVRLYTQADMFVLPSRGDCLPQAVAEALAAGLPVVATNIGALSELVNNGVNGHLVPPRDPRALGAAIEGLVQRPDQRTAFGRWSRILAEQHHDAGKNCLSIFALMARLSGTAVPATVAA